MKSLERRINTELPAFKLYRKARANRLPFLAALRKIHRQTFCRGVALAKANDRAGVDNESFEASSRQE